VERRNLDGFRIIYLGVNILDFGDVQDEIGVMQLSTYCDGDELHRDEIQWITVGTNLYRPDSDYED